MTTPDFSLLETVRLRRPLVHCVSNIVSAGDCANLALAAGALLAWRGGSLFAVAVVCCGVVFLVELAV